MHIFNIRKGFATNSSSSHSILELPESIDTKNLKTDTYDDFNWNFFTASNKESKENYLAYTVKLNLMQKQKTEDEINQFLVKLFGEEIIFMIHNVGIDHQSVIALPLNWNGKDLNEEFIKELIDYIHQDKIVIVGGNDNDEETHELVEDDYLSPINSFPKDVIESHNVARKDQDYWTIFNRENGQKMRFSFINSEAPTKATAPELADIKITDFCPYACSFCYQDSTTEGQHASLENIRKIADELEKAKVFEVACGGGETTLHPNFIEILKIFKERNIVPNFTTKNLNLFRQSNAKEIIEHCGAMAFSVQSKDEMLKVKNAFMDFDERERVQASSYIFMTDSKKQSIWNPKITFQVVLGTMPTKEFKDMMLLASEFGSRITLLGYKENGRGSSFAPNDYSEWLDIVAKIKEKKHVEVSIDTALASEYEHLLKDKKVNEKTYHTTEGTFSVYIDATKMSFAPSSYIGLEQSQPFNSNWLDQYVSMKAKPEYRKTIRIK
jgi:organic radical activating enzyme